MKSLRKITGGIAMYENVILTHTNKIKIHEQMQ